MNIKREILFGFLTTITSIIIVIGGISLSVSQGQPVSLFPTLIFTDNPVPTSTNAVIVPDQAIKDAGVKQTGVTTSPSPVSSPTEMLPTNCLPPPGWQPYAVPPGANLEELARRNGITTQRLMEANCLVSKDLVPNVILYIPALTPRLEPSQTRRPAIESNQPVVKVIKVTPVPCGKPHEWVIYYVQEGDTLDLLGETFMLTVTELQQANCLGNSTNIISGQRLYVPVLSTPTPPVLSTQASTPLAVKPHPIYSQSNHPALFTPKKVKGLLVFPQ